MKKIQNVLLVDDDEIANYLHTQLIKELNLAENIEIEYDGEHALHKMKEYISDRKRQQEILILLDINMPLMDGFEFLKEFHHQYSDTFENVHIALLSSSTSPKDKKEAEKYDIAGYIEKPLTVQKIKNLMVKIRGNDVKDSWN